MLKTYPHSNDLQTIYLNSVIKNPNIIELRVKLLLIRLSQSLFNRILCQKLAHQNCVSG